MTWSTTVVLAALLATGPAEDAPQPLLETLERAVADHAQALCPPAVVEEAKAEETARASSLRKEISVTAVAADSILLPDFSLFTKTVQGFGVVRGGSSGSPSFDPVTRTYWWE